MARPRILLVPTTTEIEWSTRPLIEEWADVASFDIPGIGTEPPPQGELTPEAIAERGVAEIESKGWDRCVVVGDEAGAPQAARVAALRPDLVAGIALGHATLTFSRSGERPAVNGEVSEVLARLARTDYHSFVHALTQGTQGAYTEEFLQEYMRRVPADLAATYVEMLFLRTETEHLEPFLRPLEVPLLFVEHAGCVMWNREGFEDAVAAFPDAATASVEVKPSVSPEFAEVLRDFAEPLFAG